MTVGERIKQRRIELGLSQEDLAKRMGYSGKSSVCKAETSEDNITTTKVSKFAKALNCSEKYLMGWEEQDLGIKSGELSAIVALDAELQDMIEKYLKLSDEKKASIRNMINLLSDC